MKKVGLYVHVPFCRVKCYYCDFVSYAGRREEDIRAYLSALRQEGWLYQQRYTQKGEDDGNGAIFAQSLYIGGGTPTCLTSGQLSVLFGHLEALFHLPQGIEITVEANPGTIEREKLKCLKELDATGFRWVCKAFLPVSCKFWGVFTGTGRFMKVMKPPAKPVYEHQFRSDVWFAGAILRIGEKSAPGGGAPADTFPCIS